MSSIDGLKERQSGPVVDKRFVGGQSVSPIRKAPEEVPSEKKISVAPKAMSEAEQLTPPQNVIATGMAVKPKMEEKEKNEKKEKKEKSAKHINVTTISIAGVAVVAIAVVVVVVLANIFAQPDGGGDNEGGENPALLSANYETTEEDDTITKKVVDELLEIEIGGLEKVQDDYGENSAIPVKVKNISNEKFNVAIEIVAKDKDGNPLDVASLYAEGIEPGQEQLFHAFELSTLSDEQLSSATFEVHKAYTYENGASETVTGGDVEVETEPANTDGGGNVEAANTDVEVVEGE